MTIDIPNRDSLPIYDFMYSSVYDYQKNCSYQQMLFRDLHRVINEKDTAIEKLNSEISMADEDLRRESKLRKRYI